MGPFALAWLIGEGIVTYRWIREKAPPPPGALALSSILFAGLAVVAEYRPARTTATLMAFGVDLAILLQVAGKAPQGVTGWPPPMINDPTAFLPGSNSGPGGGTLPPGTPPPGQKPPPGTVLPGPDGSCPPGYTYYGGYCHQPLIG